jgi:hypothetical protein
MSISENVQSLERDLRDVFGARLQSLVVYATRAHASHDAAQGDHARGHSASPNERATHTLAVVDALTTDDLRACAARVSSWHDRGLATPLLLAAHEFARSLDAFPLEFGAIVADHALVAGRDPFVDVRVDPADLRRACEVQARSHLLHLREGFLETRGRADALAVLIVDSAPAFAALLGSIARLQGAAAVEPAAAGRHIERHLGAPGGIVSDVVKLASVTEISSDEAVRLFPAYLDAVERLVTFVDGWQAR